MVKSGKYESEDSFIEHNPDKKILMAVNISRVRDAYSLYWIPVKLKRIYYED